MCPPAFLSAGGTAPSNWFCDKHFQLCSRWCARSRCDNDSDVAPLAAPTHEMRRPAPTPLPLKCSIAASKWNGVLVGAATHASRVGFSSGFTSCAPSPLARATVASGRPRVTDETRTRCWIPAFVSICALMGAVRNRNAGISTSCRLAKLSRALK